LQDFGGINGGEIDSYRGFGAFRHERAVYMQQAAA
jgi:hypothetical protein